MNARSLFERQKLVFGRTQPLALALCLAIVSLGLTAAAQVPTKPTSPASIGGQGSVAKNSQPTSNFGTSSGVGGVNWSVSAGHSLIWHGSRQVMAGIRVEGTPDAILAATKLGFKDLCVEVQANGPNGSVANWTPVLNTLETAGARYVLSLENLAPMADAIAVDPEGYRITGVTAPRHVSLTIPGASSVLAVLALSQDGSIQWNKQIATPDGHIELDLDPTSDLDHVLLLYPRLTSSSLIDCWDGFDQARDSLLADFQRAKPGAGCRGIIDPAGASAKLFGGDIMSVPTSPFFQTQFRNYLEARYHSVDTAISAWSMRSSGVDSFDKLARLVPLWYGVRGIPGFWDPSSSQVIPCEIRRSQAWEDIHSQILLSARQRFRHLVEAVHDLVDLPVVQDWNGWSLPYEGAPVVDGVGLVTNGSAPSVLLEQAGRASSSLIRWKSPGWMVASRIDGLDKATSAEMQFVVEDLSAIGAQSFFLQSENSEAIKKWLDVVKAIQSSPPPDESKQPLFFPENAYNPAAPQSFPGGIYWLPSPEAGDRLDFGDKIHGYSIGSLDTERAVLWSPSGPQIAKLRVKELKRMIVKNANGVVQPTKIGKGFVQVQLSPEPVIISGIHEIPVPESAIDETTLRVLQLIELAEERHRDISSEAFAYNDGVSGMDAGPGAAYLSMRKAYHSLSIKLADYTWIEAESAKTFTLGQAVDLPGCSGGRGFAIRSELSLPGQLYQVDYPVSTRTKEEQEVWVALKVSPGDRDKVRILIGSQALSLKGAPLSSYSDGFAWYRCGTTRIGSGAGSVRLELDGSNTVNVIVDAILLTPRHFVPNGISIPDAIVYDENPGKKPKKKKSQQDFPDLRNLPPIPR